MSETAWGGARPGSGRAVRNIHLDKETARVLRLLLKHRRQFAPDTTEEAIVANLIHAAWDKQDEAYQAAAD